LFFKYIITLRIYALVTIQPHDKKIGRMCKKNVVVLLEKLIGFQQ
jgi:hypothetical protein